MAIALEKMIYLLDRTSYLLKTANLKLQPYSNS